MIRARLYDRVLARSEAAGLSELRSQLLELARGRVLEIGAGTGLNVDHYPPNVELTSSEPDPAMRAMLQARSSRLGRRVEIVAASAEALPFPDDFFDTVVSTLVLCSVDEPAQALAEIRRVLKPDGTLLLLEHVRSCSARLARLQDVLRPLWRAASGGCRCNRRTVTALRQAGFDVSEVRCGELPKTPAFLRPLAFGPARPNDRSR